MYVILVYDVSVERVNKVLKICRQYLTWIQNSVFEGEISDADFIRLKDKLASVIDDAYDSITFFIFRVRYDKKITLGVSKGDVELYY